MAETIGSRLRAAREAKGMSIEDIAFETRIHAKYVRALEADDYSNFASTTYAKSFLTLYSRFLGVDAAEALHFFAGSDDIRLGGQPLLATIETIESVKAPRTPRGPERKASPATATVRRESPGFAPAILGVLVFLLVAAIPVLWFLGKDAESIGEVTTKAKEIADATQRKLDTEGVAPPSVSAVAEAPDAEPVGKPAAAEPAGKSSRERERSVAADWVLEEEERNREPVGAPEADSTLDTPSPVTAKPVDTPDADAREEKALPGSDPGASSALVAVAVSEEELGNENTQPGPPTPQVAVAEDPAGSSPPTEGAFPADVAEGDAETGTEPPKPGERKKKPQPEQDQSSEESPPTEESPGEADTPPAPAPLRAVPLIARPLAVPMEAGPGDEEGGAADPAEEASTEEGEDSAVEAASSTPRAPTVATPVTVPRERNESRSREEQRKRETAAEPEETPEEREERTFVDPRHRFPRPLR